ncbi:hypothetical protein [Sinomonas sp. P47F7]|uniref:hypothetical protein n=1 Tax=Sinomonas sp. P47F7 TaxID=3410987 RepID=UPI003BF5F8B7
MNEEVIIAFITGLTAILVAYLEKNRRDTKRIRRDARAVHESVNNRTDENGNPISLSDRLDAVMGIAKEAAASAKAAREQGQRHQDELAEQRHDIRGIREDNQATRRELGLLHKEDRDIRTDLNTVVESTAEWGRFLTDLHTRWGHSREKSEEGT